jgi:GNAT superfamily N-acetyltransferase
MEAGDAGAVARLSGELGYPAAADDIATRLAGLAGRPGQALFVSEAPSGEILGWIHVSADATLTDGPTAEIRGLVVDARFRRQGIGRALVAEAERWAASRGYPRLRVRSRIVREDAHRFYRARGYAADKTQHVFSKPLG